MSAINQMKIGYTQDGAVFFIIAFEAEMKCPFCEHNDTGQKYQTLFYFTPEEAVQLGKEMIATGEEAKGIKDVGQRTNAN